MRIRSRTSLEARLCVLTVGTLFVVLLGVGHFAMREQTQLTVSERHRSFDAVTRALALIAEPLIAEQNAHVSGLLSERLRNSSWDLRYIIIADENGNTVYVDSPRLQPERQSFVGQTSWRVVRNVLGYEGIDGSKLYTVTVPVRISENRWGNFTAGYSMVRTQAIVDEIQSRVLLAFAAAMLIGIVCSIAYARSVAYLLRSLVRGARAVAGGNFSYRVPMTKMADELGHLVEAFNYMADTLNRTQEHLVESAGCDILTGLYNHRNFHERLAAEMSRALQHSHPLALLMIDVDRLQNLNISHGHAAGDAALANIGALLRETFRETDVCARYGGDEFVVLLPETSAKEALVAAERTRHAIEKHRFVVNDGEESLTVSIGLAVAAEGNTDVQSLLTAADIAVHQAKAEGRNRIVQYKPELREQPEKAA